LGEVTRRASKGRTGPLAPKIGGLGRSASWRTCTKKDRSRGQLNTQLGSVLALRRLA
jgi:hypothetical protein